MKWSRFVFKLLMLATLLCSLKMKAQDTASRPALLPDYLKLQFAGNIGFFSLGVGYENKKRSLEGDFFYGYVPKSAGGLYIHTVSSKLTWHAVKPVKKTPVELRPFSLGILASYTFGKQYFGFTPDNYPYDYYKFPTAFHAGLFVGGQINWKKAWPAGIKRLGLYYELVSFDTEMLNYLNNPDVLKFSDIWSLAIGMRAAFQ